MDYKQVILVRKDLKLTGGKGMAQASHASVESVLKSNRALVKAWRRGGMKKVVLRVENLDELFTYKKKAEDARLVCALITDAGHTHLEPGTVTCLAIGPDEEESIDAITGSLPLVS